MSTNIKNNNNNDERRSQQKKTNNFQLNHQTIIIHDDHLETGIIETFKTTYDRAGCRTFEPEHVVLSSAQQPL